MSLALTFPAAHGAGFNERLQAVSAAIDAYLSSPTSSAGSSASAPTVTVQTAPLEWRKLLWFYLVGDRLADALVVLRYRRDECAAASQQPCKALVLTARSDGSYRVVTEFTLRVHPVALQVSADGVRDLLYARDTGDNPVYARYRFDGDAFQRVEGDVTAAQFQETPLLVADDRSMALWSDQAYAGRQFANDGARLAPFRLHFDSATVGAVRREGYNPAGAWYPKDFATQASTLAEALLPDAQALTRSVPWPHTLELRLWSCVDWVVERRFWEVEDRRLGRPGTCVEPALFALSKGLVKPGAPQLDIARLALLQQVGMAYALRVAPVTPAQRARWRKTPDEARFTGAVAGLMLGHGRQILPFDRAAHAVTASQALAELWFNEIEREQMRFVTPTPELRDYIASLALVATALQCARQAVAAAGAKPPAKNACTGVQLDVARRLAAQLREDSKPL
jgi:hypothetical protein